MIQPKRVKRAEDEGFEPSRLSSTRVRDARTRPLCESSVGIIGVNLLPLISFRNLICECVRYEFFQRKAVMRIAECEVRPFD